MTFNQDEADEIAKLKQQLAAERRRADEAEAPPPVIEPRGGSTIDTHIPETQNPKGRFSKGGGNIPFMWIIAIAVVVSLVVGYFMVGSIGVTKANFTKNLGNVATDIASLKESATAMQQTVTALDAALGQSNNIISALNKDVMGIISDNASYASQSALDSAVSQLTTLNSEVATIKASLESIKSNIADLSALEGDVTSLSSEISTLSATLKTANDKITDLTTRLAAAEAYITQLKAGTTTTPPPTTTTTTTTTTGVYATVVSSTVTLTPATSFKNTFNITIVNNTANDIYGGQLAFSIQIIGLPSGEDITLALPSGSLVSSLVSWHDPTINTPTTAYYIGDFTGYINKNSSYTVSITVDATSASSGNLTVKITNPTIGGYTPY